ncbi:hypothetical protein [Sphingomonas sp. KR3-1]|uniref:hypothetical protein n=1 Tax=Sphingomonas sp. KR3-1 TaxID=3156611 RepID=UPI0032B435C5
MMADRQKDILARIADAFAERGLPPDEPMFAGGAPDLDAAGLAALAQQGGWQVLPWNALCANSAALAFATPAAFAYLLPACMCASLAHYAKCGALTSMLLTCLTPQDDSDIETMAQLERDFEELEPGFLDEDSASWVFARDEGADEAFEQRVALLTGPERDAVRAYLQHLDEAHGRDFPVFGPREALDRFWAAPDRDGART